MKTRKTLILVSALLLTGTLYSQDAFDVLLRAKALTATGNSIQAIATLSGTREIMNDSRLLIARAEAKVVKGDYQGATEDFNSANRILQNSGEYGLARIYAVKGDVTTSLHHLELHMKSLFRKSEKEILLDPAFAKIENSADWRLFWKRDWYSVPEQKISEIEFYIRAGKIDEASAALSELEMNYKDDESAIYGSSLIKIASGKPGDAIKSINILLSAEPENEKYLRTLAAAQIAGSNPSGASVTYSRLINMQIPDAELFLLRADCYRKTGEKEKAMSDINKYLTCYPESKTALSLAGKTESSSGNNLKALEYFTENLRLHPNDAECYIDRGNSYLLSKSWQWAINDYSMSLDLAPDNSDVWLNKGIALVNSGKSEDACHDFRRSFALGNRKAVDFISKYCIK